MVKPQGLAAPLQRPVLSWLLPSTADILFLAVLSALAFGYPRLSLLNDPGIGWHIRTGEWILVHHQVPHVDLFGAQARSWFAWEWLTDVALAGLNRWGGLNAVLTAGAAVIALVFGLLFQMTRRRGAAWLVAVGFVALAVCASTIHFLARPHILSWLLTLVSWYVLETSQQPSRKLWWLVPIACLWANLHGGFVFLFFLIGMSLVGEAWSVVTANDDDEKRIARSRFGILTAVGAVSFLATLVNPYGFALYRHITQYLGDSFLMSHIQEFQSPDFHVFAPRCFAVLVAIAFAVAVIQRQRLRPAQIIVLLAVVASALVAVRNIPLASILITMTLAPLAGSLNGLPRLMAFSERMERMENSLRGHVWPVAVLLIVILACSRDGKLSSLHLLQAEFNPERYPVAAVKFLAEHPQAGPIFTTDSWGGYAIYRLWPQMRVVVDDRHDMYGSGYMRDYLTIIHGEPGWDQNLKDTGAGLVLISAKNPLASLLALSPSWKQIYGDSQAIVFTRKTAE